MRRLLAPQRRNLAEPVDVDAGLRLLRVAEGGGVSRSPFSEGGALMALGLIHANRCSDESAGGTIAYLKACRETPDKAPGLEKKMKAKTAQLAALQDQGIDAHPSWADVE